jgi:uncharacterized alkaline shock family protein YloU
VSAAATTPAGAAQRGRTRITSKALNRVVSAVTADALGVDSGRVGVDLADRDGLLGLTVTTPIRVVSLARIESDASVVGRSGGTIVDRSRQAQETIRDRVTEITGSSIDRVTVKVSGVDIQPEERVR